MTILKRGAVSLQTVTTPDIKVAGSPDPSLALVVDLPQQWNVVVADIPSAVTTTNGLAGLKLPPDSDVELCDVVEIHVRVASNGGTLLIYDDSNTLLAGVPGRSDGAAIILRKIDATTWRILSGQ